MTQGWYFSKAKHMIAKANLNKATQNEQLSCDADPYSSTRFSKTLGCHVVMLSKSN